jgi:hypothetical protein
MVKYKQKICHNWENKRLSKYYNVYKRMMMIINYGGCLVRDGDCLPYARNRVHLRLLVVSVLLIFLLGSSPVIGGVCVDHHSTRFISGYWGCLCWSSFYWVHLRLLGCLCCSSFYWVHLWLQGVSVLIINLPGSSPVIGGVWVDHHSTRSISGYWGCLCWSSFY